MAVDGLPRVTAAYIQSETTFGGLPHHFLLGGINGVLHVHSLTGRLILEHETEGASPITAITEKRHRCALGSQCIQFNVIFCFVLPQRSAVTVGGSKHQEGAGDTACSVLSPGLALQSLSSRPHPLILMSRACF